MRCENLDVWKRASRLSADIYIYFKDCKDYGFKDQITRSSLSIASNIAEGVERFSNQETIRFLDIARASSAELITQIYVGIEINYIEKELGLQWKKEIEEIAKMITSLIKKYKGYK
jgi:four helix bundle protein